MTDLHSVVIMRWVDLEDFIALHFMFDTKTHLQALHGCLDFCIHHTFDTPLHWIKITGGREYKFRFFDRLQKRCRRLVLTPTPWTLFARQLEIFLWFEQRDEGRSNRLVGCLRATGKSPELVKYLDLTEYIQDADDTAAANHGRVERHFGGLENQYSQCTGKS